MTIAMYVRVSSQEQKMRGYSADEQIETLKGILKRQNLLINENFIFVDKAYSGGKVNRPQLQKMFKKISEGKIKKIFIKNSSRLTREPLHKYAFKKVFEKYGVEVVSLEGIWNSKNENENVGADIQTYIDSHMRKQVSPDTIRGMKHAAKIGNYPFGGIPPRGYERVFNEKVGKGYFLKPIDEYIPHIVFLFESLKNREHNFSTLTRLYNKKKIMGVHWSKNGIEKIVSNPIYYGHLKKNEYDFPNHTIPIISKKLFYETQKSLRMIARENKYMYSYSPLVFCKNCQSYCSCESAYGKMKKVYLYHLCKKCRKRIREDQIEKHIGEYLNVQMNDVDKKNILQNLLEQQKRKELRLNFYEEEFDNYSLDLELFQKKVVLLKKEILKLQNTIEDLKNSEFDSFFKKTKIEKKAIVKKNFQRIEIDFQKNKEIILISKN